MILSRKRIALTRFTICLTLAAGLGGCGWDPGYPDSTNTRVSRSAPQARTQPKPRNYQVRRGDTLYGIAFRYGLDHHAIASWNRLRSPYTIYPGQTLRLTAPPEARVVRQPAAPKQPAVVPPRRSTTQESPAPRAPVRSAPTAAPTRWQWPTEGRVVSTFLANDPSRKGIDIAGADGQKIRAVADGQVVYSGNGLVGYGELVIIKHSESLLSAYGHNKRRLVSEGDAVKAGQNVAEMGNSGSETTKLHFEMRINGVPVDPQRYLPDR